MQDNFGKVFCLLRPVAGPAIRERENVRHLGHQQAKSDRRFSSNGPSEDASTFTGAQTRDVFADGGEEVTDRERFYPDQFTNPAPASSMKIDSLLDSVSEVKDGIKADLRLRVRHSLILSMSASHQTALRHKPGRHH